MWQQCAVFRAWRGGRGGGGLLSTSQCREPAGHMPASDPARGEGVGLCPNNCRPRIGACRRPAGDVGCCLSDPQTSPRLDPFVPPRRNFHSEVCCASGAAPMTPQSNGFDWWRCTQRAVPHSNAFTYGPTAGCRPLPIALRTEGALATVRAVQTLGISGDPSGDNCNH